MALWDTQWRKSAPPLNCADPLPCTVLWLQVGQRVRWHVASVGNFGSLHNYHWHGNVVEVRMQSWWRMHLARATWSPGALALTCV